MVRRSKQVFSTLLVLGSSLVPAVARAQTESPIITRVRSPSAWIIAAFAALVAGQGVAGAQSVESPTPGSSVDTHVPWVTVGAAASTSWGESGHLGLLSVQFPISRSIAVEGEFTRSAPGRWQFQTSTVGANVLWRAGTPHLVGFVGGGIGMQRSAIASPDGYLPDQGHGVIQQVIGGVDVPFARYLLGFAAVRGSTAPEDGIKAVAGVRVSLGTRVIGSRQAAPLSTADQAAPRSTRQVAAQGKTVRVTRLDGSRQTGKLITLSGSEVVLREGTGSTSIPLSAVHKVERVTHYARIGAAIGASSILILAPYGLGNCSDCGEARGYVIGYALAFTGIGAAIGAMTNVATRDGHLLYLRPGASTSLSVAPILGPQRAGVGVAMQW